MSNPHACNQPFGTHNMKFLATKLAGVYIVDLDIHPDSRGFFTRVFCKRLFQEIGHTKEFVQFNHSLNYKRGTLRGLHYQAPPACEVKLIRCIRGVVFDVVVDIRQGSPTFLQHVSVELSSENKRMIYIPEGCAHGFQALEDGSELLYYHTEFHVPEAERGVHYNDSKIHISWPEAVTAISDRDAAFRRLDDDFQGIVV